MTVLCKRTDTFETGDESEDSNGILTAVLGDAGTLVIIDEVYDEGEVDVTGRCADDNKTLSSAS